MPKARVYITHGRPGFTYDEAEVWSSDLRYVTFAEWTPTGMPGVDKGAIMAEIRQNMADYRPGIDYLLMSGSPIIIMFIGSLLPAGHHNLLKWNRTLDSYELCIMQTGD